ncbi:MAG: ABC transporter ATP-binding protein [Desulfobacterales bacterium]|jgi:ABC-type branched-subunit amino acid transport system ATPase component
MLLEVNNIDAGYGSLMVLRDVSLHVARGEIVCIIGPNGAGKSTVLRAVAGQITPARGNVLLNATDVTGVGMAAKGRNGLIFIPQGDNIFPNLTVLENLEMAGLLLQDGEKRLRAIEQALEKFGDLKKMKKRPARELSGGQRQMLALSRILLIRPQLVLLDEPSLGLSPMVVDLIFREIQEMNKADISFLLVEQNARKALSVSHRGYVLELGRNRLTGSGRQLLDNPDVQRLYLGG